LIGHHYPWPSCGLNHSTLVNGGKVNDRYSGNIFEVPKKQGTPRFPSPGRRIAIDFQSLESNVFAALIAFPGLVSC
jgi:hypothetical protein